VKKIDYYAVQNPWRMPKWLGATLGGIFGVIVIGSMITIVQLTKSATPAPVVAVAAAPIAQTAAVAPVAAAPAVKATAPVASADDAAPAKRATKKHAAAHGKKAKLMASAKHMPAPSTMGSAQRQTILAKHDTKDKRHEKDALDKLLGL
jgi:predicted lipid-binding transport protein (Tim44 family)